MTTHTDRWLIGWSPGLSSRRLVALLCELAGLSFTEARGAALALREGEMVPIRLTADQAARLEDGLRGCGVEVE